MRITIKIGSNVLTRQDGSLDVTRMSALVDQIANLRNQGHEVILVSSGAVASGRSELKHIQHDLDSVDQRQLFSAVGQAKLINRYFELFKEYGIAVGQVLTTKENFSDTEHRRNQENCMKVMLENDVLPIVNENDRMTQSQMLIILSNIDGIYTGDPSNPASQLIRTIEPGKRLDEFIQEKKSSAGRGGMQSKSNVAIQTASAGISVIIANGKRDDILIKLMNDRENTPCTEFIC